MIFENAGFTDPEHKKVSAKIDGRPAAFPANLANRHYRNAVAQGIVISDYVDPIVSDYAELRRGAYASLRDQLDMQFHDLLDGTTTWRDHVAAVKASHPKPK